MDIKDWDVMWGDDDKEVTNRFACLTIIILLAGFWMMVAVIVTAYVNRS